MKPNLHRIDQFVRSIIAVICIYVGFIDSSWIAEPVLSIAVGVFGIINLLAVIARFCPFYHLAGISTYRPEIKNK